MESKNNLEQFSLLDILKNTNKLAIMGLAFGLMIGSYLSATLINIKYKYNCLSISEAASIFINKEPIGLLAMGGLIIMFTYMLYLYNKRVIPEILRRSNENH